MDNLKQPLQSLHWVSINKLQPNNYNPNRVVEQNLKLLVRSILLNGFTMPIVCTPNYVIIDGYHRYLVASREPLLSKLNGQVPIVVVAHNDEANNIYGTIAHNRARGVHLLEPMKALIKNLLNVKNIKEVARELGMKEEEVFRLSDFSREDFLNLIIKSNTYSQAEVIKRI
jgi:ParB-like chromosome segregation protein Spo0J